VCRPGSYLYVIHVSDLLVPGIRVSFDLDIPRIFASYYAVSRSVPGKEIVQMSCCTIQSEHGRLFTLDAFF
jgi:hypothetical protein